ncbi:MAG: hypothetical protein HOE48_17880 [Candidatus Latescibacteria bacterium]|jgi:chromosome segregation ATPase|nr:hypothetical protein [Candidatus Latescibacterota bacterium]MBT4139794.1 hypothetical protein [Candidatus Latescibacterota bacterium]
MILEMITFVMFAMVLVLKYGAVTRIVKLKQRLREVDARCRKHRDHLRLYQAERVNAEREQTGLIRQRRVLQDELGRINTELEMLQEERRTVIEELLRRNARIDPSLITGEDVVSDETPK